MSFAQLVFKNLLRQPVRAALTLLGISIGITTVVALGLITGGLRATAEDIIHIGGADFIVGQKGAADLSFSTVTEEEWAAVAALPGVERASGALLHISRVGDQPFFVLVGTRPEDLAANPPELVAGAVLPLGATDRALLGVGAAATLGTGVGDTVTIADRRFIVDGIYRGGGLWLENGAYAPLATVQQIASRAGVVTIVHVTVAAGFDPEEVALRIEANFGGLTTIANTEQYGRVDQGFELLDAANIAISMLAVGIGAIGVMNTLIMAVFERTREIGVLRAVGWSGPRVLRMIVLESLLLCVAAAAVGSALGVAFAALAAELPTVSGLLEPQYEAAVFVRALLVALFVALAGAVYPAVRATRLTPMEALRYE